MKHLQELQAKLLNDIEPKTLIESIKPMTTSGLNFVSRWLSIVNSGSNFTYSAANTFVAEASKFNNIDASITEARDVVLTYLNSNPITSKLAIIGEAAAFAQRTNVNESLCKRIDDLLVLSETAIKDKIKNGLLDSFSTMYGISNVITEASTDKVRTAVDTVKVKTPVSYVEAKEGFTHVRCGRYIFKVNENNVTLGTSPSEKFNYLSTVVEHSVVEDDEFEFDTEFGEYKIDEKGKLKKVKEEDEEEEITVESFIKNAKLVIESKYVGAGSRVRREQSSRIADAIVAIKENYGNIVKLDNFVIAENKNFEERVGIIVCKESHVVFVESSKRYPSRVQSFSSISEAIERFKTLTKVDLTERFKTLVEQEEIEDEEVLAAAKECQDDIKEIDNRIEDIQNEMADTEKDSDAYEKFEEALSVAKALRLECSEKLSEILKNK